MPTSRARQRAAQFANRFDLRAPFLMAPMAGACPPALAAAVANGGGMGALGAVLLQPDQVLRWVVDTRARCAGPLQGNLWIPDPPAHRDAAHEARVIGFLESFGTPVPAAAADTVWPAFDEQLDALLTARFEVVSSIMGVFQPDQVEAIKRSGAAWFACVTTVNEARAAEAAGADVLVAQGAEAGGHRGAFDAHDADERAVGLFALLPQVVDAVSLPVIATGGIADARGFDAALCLGASGVQVGTALLRCPEADIAPGWQQALADAGADGTRLTRAFSGRWGRAVNNRYVQASAESDVEPAPYPIQRALTAPLRKMAGESGSGELMQAWCGQAAALTGSESAQVLPGLWWTGPGHEDVCE